MALKVALAKLPMMAVQGLADVCESSLPVIGSILLGTGAETTQVPPGAGVRSPTQSSSPLAWTLLPSSLSCTEGGKLGQGDGPLCGSGYLLGAFNTYTNVNLALWPA